MKKIGLLTWFNHNNYGTVLQAYALTNYLKSLGFEVVQIDYHRNINFLDYTKLLKISYIRHKVYYILHNRKFFEGKNQQQERKFNEFRSKYFDLKFYSVRTIKKSNSLCDIFICGSDQIWNTNFFDSKYFLDFAYREKTIASYAASFGGSKIELVHKKKIKELLSKFDYISVRELESIDEISKLGIDNVEMCVDPTLLMDSDEWDKMLNSKISVDNGYILCYLLSNNDYYNDVIKLISKRTGLRVIVINNETLETSFESVNNAGPEDFINYIKNSDFVITDSYHGMIFSIIYKKEFYILERFDNRSKNNQNSRVYNLLRITGVTNRLVLYNTLPKLSNDHIDYNFVMHNLQNYVNYSKEFILRVVNMRDKTNE